MEGRTLAHFRIEAKIGAGGMGEVYRALDTRLGRAVAIKVLPAAFARDPERLARMEREARLLASLNHPNIAVIHGLEEAEGARFLVMELVPGESLEQRLAREAIPPEETLSLCRQIAAALEAAHDRGIIHRDLKPANVVMTPDGTVKVLDFGLARLVEEAPPAEPTQAPTVAADATREGAVLGTASYMSPEQARGLPLDRRTDLWSFGCVLYEMLARRRAFPGRTVSDTLAAILREDPDWDALPQGTPRRIRQLLSRCLSKDLPRRQRDAGDARLDIEEAAARTPETAAGVAARHGRGRAAAWAVLAAAILIAVGFAAGSRAGWRGSGVPDSWWGEILVGGATIVFNPRVSPDGQLMAFQILVDDNTQVAVMKPGSGRWSVLTHGKKGSVFHLSWSPDGTRIYFDRASDSIWSVPALGGDERMVLEGYAIPEVLPDGSLLVGRTEGDRGLQYSRYWPETGKMVPLGPRYRPMNAGNQMRVSADGRQAAFFGVPEAMKDAHPLPRLFVMEIESGQVREIARDLTFQYSGGQMIPLAMSRDGRWVYVVEPAGDIRRLVAIPRADGPPRALMTFTSPVYYLDAAPDGSIYADQVDRPLEVLRFPATGGIPERIGRATGGWSRVSNPLELPDGRFLVHSTLSGRHVLMAARPREDPAPFIETQETTSAPAAMIGERQVAFFMGDAPRLSLAIATIDGRIVKRITQAGASDPSSLAASPDGATLYYSDQATVWAADVSSGVVRKLCAGDAVVVEPATGDLIIQVNEPPRPVLVRMAASGGEARKIFESAGAALAPNQGVTGNAILPDGRTVFTLSRRDSWFWSPAVLDLGTGKVTGVPIRYDGDANPSVWGRDGSILSMGWGLRTDIWRFRPSPGSRGGAAR